MSPGRDSFSVHGEREELPEPAVSVPDEFDVTDPAERQLQEAAAVVSLPGLVLRRVRWAIAPLLAAVARWIGQTAAHYARQEAAARYALTVARYERKLMESRKSVHRWRTLAEARDLELEATAAMHTRLTARIQADTVAVRAAEMALTRGN